MGCDKVVPTRKVGVFDGGNLRAEFSQVRFLSRNLCGESTASRADSVQLGLVENCKTEALLKAG
jgi:hypothetical protein